MSQSRRNHNGGGGGNQPPPPAVPSITRRSNSFQKEDSVLLANSRVQMSRSSSATDEFGFPLTQQLRSSVSVPHPHAQGHGPGHGHVSQQTDLERVHRPIRLQQQRGGHSQTPETIQQYYSQSSHQNQSQSQHQYMQPHQSQPVGPSLSLTRTNSASSSASAIQKGHSRNLSASSSSRPPRSHPHSNTSFTRQSSHQSSASSKLPKSTKNNRPPKIKISKPDPSKYKNYTFQHPANSMRVTARSVDLSHRIAFDARIPPNASSSNLRRMLEEMDRVRGSRSTVGSICSAVDNNHFNHGNKKLRSGDNPCRISPSPNHMAILEFIHGNNYNNNNNNNNSRGLQQCKNKVIRQLQWNAACSVDADPWFRGFYEEEGEHHKSLEQGNTESSGVSFDKKRSDADAKQRISNEKKKRSVRRKPKSVHGDGRYIPIDPLSTTKSMLPDHSPILTNAKRRLPMRSDVGFANPSPEEVAKKMEEVKKEAEWEEASPRIVLLFSAFPLFDGEKEEEEDMYALHPSCRDDAKLWAGGSILGVPFAGRDLVAACKMAAGFEKERNTEHGSEGQNQQCADMDKECAMNPRSYSVFAPPVDATFSSSHQWRPRPFMDRPPGFVYFLACPLDVRFEAGDVEPYFCTMTLYSLPKGSQLDDGSDNANNNFCGKISEDFFFPAGDWNGIEGVGASFDDEEEQPQSWRRRKRRAIMSYDPLEVSAEDLHLVIQVFRVVQPNHDSGMTNDTAIRPKQTIGNKIKRSLLHREKSHARTQQPLTIQTASRSYEDLHNSLASFEEVGAQYLTPVCFSVTRAFNEKETWQKQEKASFFPLPESPESQGEFVTRLACIANPKESTAEANPAPIDGYTDVLTSYLGRDFTRALLDEPPQLHNALDDGAPLGPQLLADVMGDCAISFDGPTSERAKRQRSKLRRLPPSRESGYSSSFDLKEVLYFPPRSLPRQYEEDTALCSSTVLNLIYVYPRLVRWSSSRMNEQTNSSEYMSLRVQVVEQELPPDQSFDSADPTYQALHAIYNPSCIGPPLVESFFTKLVKRSEQKDGKTKSSRTDVPLKDEVKVRLPDILDRRHFLQFSLFSVRSGADIELVAETTIPFIISSKESTSGGRVTTIIPNGLHRIQLSEGLQIHAETRLASSHHISDPSVATLLRDYPIPSNPAGDMDSTTSTSDVIVHASSGYPFADILNMASGQAVKRHFLSLVTVSMLNFVNQNCPPFYFEQLFDKFGSDSAWYRLVSWEKTDSLLAIIRSLFEILDKTRTSYQERDRSMISLQYQRLVKSFLDTFDEPLFAHHQSNAEDLGLENGESTSERHFNESIDSSQAFLDSTIYDEPSSTLNDSKDDRISRNKYQFSSPRNMNNINPRSFSRRAFVATRTEQMKAEAEMNNNDVYGREYFDDDETVVTLGTITSRMDTGSVFPVILETKSFATVGIQDEIRSKNSTVGIQEETSRDWTCAGTPERLPPLTKLSTPFSFASKRAEYMANRVNTMAQLVMAPCIAPSIDELDSDWLNGSPRHSMNGSPSNGKVRVTSKFASYGGNKDPFEQSSDVEEEGDTKSVLPYLRGNQSCLKIPPLVFQPMRDSDNLSVTEESHTVSTTPYLYEVVISLWVQSWTSFAASTNSDTQVQGSSNTVPAWPFELVQGSRGTTTDAVVPCALIRHMSFFLPLCLKSIGLRCAQINTTKLLVPMTFLDDNHIQILVPLVETIALGLMREAMSGSNGIANSDQMLMKALSNSDCVMDFISGLFALLHPSQVATLLLAYLSILEACENNKGKKSVGNMNKSHLRCIKCARQVRLHAVERLATLPTFAGLNFPLKFTGMYPRRKKASPTSWTNQHTTEEPDENTLQKNLEKVDRCPQSFWLSELLMNQCLSICKSSFEVIIMEAKKQSRATKQRRRVDEALSQDDLVRMESLAFHSILCAYEMLIKRQSMDSRFQTMTSSTRVAALFTKPVLQQSVDATLLLTRMNPDKKVRLIWLLCLLYILQEGPDAMVRDELRRFCKPENYQMSNFIDLLKLASTSCQHFIPSDESLPVLGRLSREMTQEAFNCVSATVILLIDECYDVISEDGYNLENFGNSIFDVLLHVLTTPQSSVTLLRTLGGSAHALDKFGVRIFLKAAGNQLQHWGRIVLTMMNSTELSVRSMSVDFLVSLISDIYQELGSIEVISLCILSVLPEVVAREIALCSASGLIKSMGDTESSLWPLRRALADVEETNPLDDDRVDQQMLPSLNTLCRTGQAIIDGVLVEMRLRGSSVIDLDKIAKAQRSSPLGGFNQLQDLPPQSVFDADEESILEAASFFSPDSSLTQKLRWLYALRDLHVAKKQWSEVSECLILCAHSLIKSLDHLPNMWQPSQFELWNDFQRSPWLSSVCSASVMGFANAFSEPRVLIHPKGYSMPQGHLSLEGVCLTLISVIDQFEVAYTEEEGMADIACSHLEELLNMINATINNESKRYHTEARASLRRVRANICFKLAKLTEHDVGRVSKNKVEGNGAQVYVRVVLHGSKPKRFEESTTIPTFFEWEMPSICRVSRPALMVAARMKQQNPTESWEECICQTFAKPFIEALRCDDANHSIVLRTRGFQMAADVDETSTFFSVMVVQKKSSIKSRKFFIRHGSDITEYTVAHKFPHALSRQRTLVTSEIKVCGQK